MSDFIQIKGLAEITNQSFYHCRSGVQNAIKIATCIAKEQLKESSLLGRIPPM